MRRPEIDLKLRGKAALQRRYGSQARPDNLPPKKHSELSHRCGGLSPKDIPKEMLEEM